MEFCYWLVDEVGVDVYVFGCIWVADVEASGFCGVGWL